MNFKSIACKEDRQQSTDDGMMTNLHHSIINITRTEKVTKRWEIHKRQQYLWSTYGATGTSCLPIRMCPDTTTTHISLYSID